MSPRTEPESLSEDQIERKVERAFELIEPIGAPDRMTKVDYVDFMESVARQCILHAGFTREELGRSAASIAVPSPIVKEPKRVVTSDQARVDTKQHTKPCGDCPWARASVNGWLGNMTAEQWVHAAHGDGQIDCHTVIGPQCAGAAIYRRNVCKRVDPGILELPADRELVFARQTEFIEHHAQNPNLQLVEPSKLARKARKR